MSADDPVPNWKLNQLTHDLQNWLDDERKRGSDADRRNKEIAEAHREGWKLTARAIADGFKLLADAVRDSRR